MVLLTLCLTVLSSGWTLGCIPSDSHGGRPPDGTLRCYQCNSVAMPLCSLKDWKYANQSVRRVIEGQCPRRVSAFCYLRIEQNDSIFTERGCFRGTFNDGSLAKVGCLNMGTEYRVCLCNGDLCNSATSHFSTTLGPPARNSFLVLLFTFITSNVRSL